MSDKVKTKSIFVVEDEKPYSRALVLKLQHAGFEAKSAGDGEEALAILQNERFDLIMLDLVMPKMNGFAVLEEMKKRGIKTDVIVLSNLAQEEDRKKIEALGVKKFIEKSNTPIADVINTVQKFLNN